MPTYIERWIFMGDFKQGFKDCIGLAFSVILFGGLFAAAAASKGVSIWHIIMLSTTVFAGSAQFTTLAVWGMELPLLTVIISAFLIASRHIIMGIVIGHMMQGHPKWKVYPSLFVFGDMSYVLGLSSDHVKNKFTYFLGIGFTIYFCWILGTVIGAFLNEYLSAEVIKSLAFAGIMFLGMLMILLVKSNQGYRLPLIVAALISILLYYFQINQAAIMLVSVVAGGICNIILEKYKRKKFDDG